MITILAGELGVFSADGQLLQKLSENMSFGERALRIEENLKNTIVALKPTVTCELTRNDFQEQVFHLEHGDRVHRRNYLDESEHLQHLDKDSLNDINLYLIPQCLNIGETIYEIGADSDKIYILKSGTAAVYSLIELEEHN